MANEDHTYFRNKQLTTRAKWHQKVLRPLAAWIAQYKPEDFIANGFIWVGFSLLIPWFVLNFFSLTLALPWIFMVVFVGLASISWALQKGKR